MAPKASPKRANKTAKNKIMGRPFVEGDKLYLHFSYFVIVRTLYCSKGANGDQRTVMNVCHIDATL